MTRGVLAVLGGSFNPPHMGHAMIPAYLFARELADRVIVAPTYTHALGKPLRPFEERLGLVEAAMGHYGRRVMVSDVERELAEAHPERPSYSLHLLEHLAAAHPDAQVRLVIGSDIIETGETQRWHRYDRIQAAFEPIVVPRAGYGASTGALPEVSSTEIRQRLGRDGPSDPALAPLVPAAVLRRLQATSRERAVGLFGRGHVSHHMARWLADKGMRVRVYPSRDPQQWGGDALEGALLLTRDADLPRLAEALVGRLEPGTPVLHAAGSVVASEALKPLADVGHDVGTLHPICSLRREHPHRYLEHAGFGIEARGAAREFALGLIGDAPIIELTQMDARARASYHAACALAANHLAVLRETAVGVLADGNAGDAMDVLLASSLENLWVLGVPAGVTGPISRGDHATVEHHLEALRAHDHTAAADLYQTLSEALARLLSERGE